MNPDEKSGVFASSSEVNADSPPPYTAQPSVGASSSEINDERNPATITGAMGEKKVFTTYHIYLDQNYLRTFTGAEARHLNSHEPAYRFECPSDGEHAGQELMHAVTPTSSTLVSTATFEKDFARSSITFSDGRTVAISVVKRASARQETRLFRLDIENSKPERIPSVMFWEMGAKNYEASTRSVGNYELIDEDRKPYAVLLTAHHKSMKKLGRLHFLVEPEEGLVELVMGSLLAIWKKADMDVRSGHVGLRT